MPLPLSFDEVADQLDSLLEQHDAIRGKGAFRMFRATIEDAGVREQWDAFKREALREIVRDALDELGLPYQ